MPGCALIFWVCIYGSWCTQRSSQSCVSLPNDCFPCVSTLPSWEAGSGLVSASWQRCTQSARIMSPPHLCLPHPAVPAMCMKAWSKRGSGDLRSDWWGQDIHGIQVSKLLRKDLIPHGYVPWKEGFWCRSYLMLIEI